MRGPEDLCPANRKTHTHTHTLKSASHNTQRKHHINT